MSQKDLKNIGASIRQRLLNLSRSEKVPFHEVLQHYAMDRFLYRLSKSEYAENFILKGGLMFKVWGGLDARPTQDIDLLGTISNDTNEVLKIMQEIASLYEADGLEMHAERAKASLIKKDGDSQGVRVQIPASLSGASITIRIDLGVGDSLYPHPEILELPIILDQPCTKLTCYSKETLIAEKFEAMVKLADANTRMKDFHDLWYLSRFFDFDGARLGEAVKRTFVVRNTELPDDLVCLTLGFSESRASHWKAFRNKMRTSNAPEAFESVVRDLRHFLNPLLQAIKDGKGTGYWKAENYNWSLRADSQ